ncbi:MAG: 30S ribosomal protein S6 [Actinomycetota bacterium]|nr:30S ribosomal protein S6 [Actinomycetota bacterium]
MAHDAPLYDLMLLLSTGAPDEERAKILADVQSAIAAGGGTVVRDDQWGTRPLTYRIAHEAEAEYHLLQLNGPAALLESLSHNLRIADSVLRFRIIKVRPGTPPPPSSPPPVVAPVAASAAAAPPATPAPAPPASGPPAGASASATPASEIPPSASTPASAPAPAEA